MIALISVSDKAGVVEFALGLAELGFDIYSTGGTQRHLAEAGLSVHSVSSLTGFPEILDGRVKTLHPTVHGGILARRDLPAHMEELARSNIPPIDLVCVNLYPFAETVARPDVSLDDALENIDIGGPTLLRAAAKNFPHVLALVDPADYEPVLDLLRQGEGDPHSVPADVRRRLAEKAFQHVAAYDSAIAQYLHGEPVEPMRGDEPTFPDRLTIALAKQLDLRYGENPHQRAALYREERAGRAAAPGIVGARQLHGKELSYNNVLDADAAWAAVGDFAEPAVAIVKHGNPCGLARHPDLAEAYRRALAGDPVSAFGGIVAANRELTATAAQELADTFYEVVIAPAYADDALALLTKKRDLRILQAPAQADAEGGASALEYRRVGGGLLVQDADRYPDEEIQLRTVTKRAPSDAELADLRFAWKAAKHVK
ncbi:MAG: bifunctional phosphoribosylaminoimidazolecarboxamide formyltransferase/IMP cyclohydrolase, partial [Dehalococcoidia bacterium]